MPPGAAPGWEERQGALRRRLGAATLAEMETGTVVVLPSATFPVVELAKITGIVFYEERMLFTTLFLTRPEVAVVYLTSLPVDHAIVEYYLGFLADPVDARRRLTMVSLGEADPRPLSEKLAARPDVLAQVRAAAGGPDAAYILPFNVTTAEQAVSDALGLAVYGPHPDLARLGSKSGSRRVAQRAGVAVLAGAEDLASPAEVDAAIGAIRAERPGVPGVVVKLDNGFSGQGNAIVELTGPDRPVTERPTTFVAPGESWASFAPKLVADGGIVEELVRATGVCSPSVQLRIAPTGAVEVVSTHDQLLGGPENQAYLGCRYPADRRYRAAIEHAGLAVADVLAADGVIGSFGVDFVVRPGHGPVEVTLSEINLRMGGTTHPYWMARLAGGGSVEPVAYVATDNLKSPRLVGTTPAAVIDAVEAAGLGYDRATRTGACLHLLGALAGFGKMGVTCIGDSPADAQHRYDQVVRLLVG